MIKYKKILFIGLFAASFGLDASAQTNTFPSTGNVGIGTTSPQELLHINGNVRGSQSGALRISSGNGWMDIGSKNPSWAHFSTDRARYYFDKEIRVNTGYIGSYDENLYLRTSGNTRMTINNSNGNVGIGISNPSQKLSISNGQIFLGHSTANQVESGRIRFSEYNSSYQGGFIHYNGSSNILHIGVHEANDTNSNGDNNALSIVRLNGNVGIGTSTPGNKLEVNGTIRSKEVIVEATGWPDFVFKSDYQLPDLSFVEAFIKEHGHLPNIPSQQQVEEQGQSLGETQKLLLQKIEELTLYVIELKKENEAQQKEIEELKGSIK